MLVVCSIRHYPHFGQRKTTNSYKLSKLLAYTFCRFINRTLLYRRVSIIHCTDVIDVPSKNALKGEVDNMLLLAYFKSFLLW